MARMRTQNNGQQFQANQEFQKEVISLLKMELQNNHDTRQTLIRRASGLDGVGHDIDKECGYPKSITVQDYWRMYKRTMGKRVVSIFPKESWKNPPLVYDTEKMTETPFEEAWKDLELKHNVFHYLQRADILSGIGRFGIIVLGINDGKPLNEPVDGLREDGSFPENPPERQLLFLRVYDERNVRIDNGDFNKDTKSARFGFPEYYSVKMGVSAETVEEKKIHWSRVIHVADNVEDEELYGAPRMEDVYDYLLDIRKTGGGSSEMFWKGGFPGISFELHPNLPPNIEMDKESIRKEAEAYMAGLKRYIATAGLSAKSLSANISDPMPHFLLTMNLIAITKGIPLRVLMGSEQGKLAAEQDRVGWNESVSDRNEQYLTPKMVRPFVGRLADVGVLPRPAQLEVFWEDLNTPTDKEKAEVGALLTRAARDYVDGSLGALIGPVEWLTNFMGREQDEAEASIKSVNDYLDEEEQIDKLIGKMEDEENTEETTTTPPGE